MRNTIISTLKGIGIILVVFGHADINPENNSWLWQRFYEFIYSFHMPLFLIASGFFFKKNNVIQITGFFKRKVGGIYVPFIKWSIIYLVLHNIFFLIGIINGEYGWSGMGTKMFTLSDIAFAIVNICLRMDSYDGFLLGAYWFMRVLFWGSILLCFTSFAINMIIKNVHYSICITAIFFFILLLLNISFRITIPLVPGNGEREMFAVSFIGIGYIFGQTNVKEILSNSYTIVVSLLVLFACLTTQPSQMGHLISIKDCVSLLLSGTSGFILVYNISVFLNKHHSCFQRTLVYIGDNTFYILTFHMLMLKPISYLKTIVYDLDWRKIGCVLVIDEYNNAFWILAYVVSSVCISLLLGRLCEQTRYLRNGYRPFFLK